MEALVVNNIKSEQDFQKEPKPGAARPKQRNYKRRINKLLLYQNALSLSSLSLNIWCKDD